MEQPPTTSPSVVANKTGPVVVPDGFTALCGLLTLDLARIVVPQLPDGTAPDHGDGNCTYRVAADQTVPSDSINFVHPSRNQPNFVTQAKDTFARDSATCTSSTGCDPSTRTSMPVMVGDQGVCFDQQTPRSMSPRQVNLKWQRGTMGLQVDLLTSQTQISCADMVELALALNAKLASA